jgi:hypothetical protein
VVVAEPRWTVLISDEVAQWYATLKDTDRAYADAALNRLARQGPLLRMPHSRPLGDGLLELRFTCEGTARRITYYLDPERHVITLTTFRKQRQREQREVARAHRAMRADQQNRSI